MKIVHLNDSVQLEMEEIAARPEPQAGEVLIRVAAAGLTPAELSWYPTLFQKDGQKRAAAVPAHEFSGVVAAVGAGVTGVAIGDGVYGMNDWFEDGALAEFCVTRPEWIAPKPHSLTHAEAAATPIGALTAWQGLFDRARLQAGERVLVHGGAGGVGVYAIQLARSQGAHVICTASEANLEFVRGLGADEAIDYKATAFETVARPVDVVFDAVGGDTLERSWSLLNPGGRVVTIASGNEAAADARTKAAFFIVEPNRKQLIEIARRIDAGELQVVVDNVVPLEGAADGYLGKARKTGRGKVVVMVNRGL